MAAKKKSSLTRAILVAAGIPTVFVPGLILASVLGWDWKPDLERLTREGGYRKSAVIFPTTAKVTQILDGDTFEIDGQQTVRMTGLNAPDRGQEGWEEGREYLADLIEGEEVGLEYDTYQDDQYGRILAYVWESCTNSLGCANGKRMINWVMIKKGYAEFVVYEDRRKLRYEEFLRSASE